MPFVVRKIRNSKLYTVKNSKTGKVHAKGTTLEKATRQLRLLYSKTRSK